MKAPHKSLLEHVSREATRYGTEGAWLAKVFIPGGVGLNGKAEKRWAWCATNGRTLAVQALDANDAKEAEDADAGVEALSRSVFPVDALIRGPFRIASEKHGNIGVASIEFLDGSGTARLMDAKPPEVGSILTDLQAAQTGTRITSVDVNADLMMATLEAALAGTRKRSKADPDGLDRLVRITFQTNTIARIGSGGEPIGVDPRDVLDDSAPILVTPWTMERRGTVASVCMPIALDKEEEVARAHREKEAHKEVKRQQKYVDGLKARVAELEAELAKVRTEAAQAAQATQEVRP